MQAIALVMLALTPVRMRPPPPPLMPLPLPKVPQVKARELGRKVLELNNSTR
jgi:hypothetical protein